MHKRNAKRRCWYKYGTPGTGAEFLKAFPSVMELWEEHVHSFDRGNFRKYIETINMFFFDFCAGLQSRVENAGVYKVILMIPSFLMNLYFLFKILPIAFTKYLTCQ